MIINQIFSHAAVDPRRVAIIHNGTKLDYASFARAIEAARVYLSQLGLPASGTAVVRIDNLRDAWIICLALRSLGLTTIAVRDTKQAQVLDIRNRVCVVTSGSEVWSDDGLLRGEPLIRVTVPVEIFAKVHQGPLPDAGNAAQPFGDHILYTSGTTGTYKKVLMKAEDEDERCLKSFERTGIGQGLDQHGLGFGLWTAAGYKNPFAVFHAGGCMIFDQTERNIENIANHKSCRIFLNTSQVRRLLSFQKSQSIVCDIAEIVVSGGFLPLNLARRVIAELCPKLILSYSATEFSGSIARCAFEQDDDLFWLKPVDGRVIEIVDDAGNLCDVDQEGNLRVPFGPADCRFYLDDPETTARFFRDGCFYPGDIAVRRSDGRIKILGRVADVLNIQGQKRAVGPIEQAIQADLAVDTVCVFSGMTQDGREELVVALETDSEPSQDLYDQVRGKWRAFQSVRFVAMPAFPRTTNGMSKVDRTALRRQVFAQT